MEKIKEMEKDTAFSARCGEVHKISPLGRSRLDFGCGRCDENNENNQFGKERRK
jgi:hypothetical protein